VGNDGWKVSVNIQEILDRVIPARRAGIQIDMDISGRIFANLDAAIHAGMTKICIFVSVLMKHFVEVPTATQDRNSKIADAGI
jgi:hypothetical protein